MRPAKAEYQPSNYSDEMVHITVTIELDVHKRLVERLHLENRLNRTQWVREAIDEKLAKPARI